MEWWQRLGLSAAQVHDWGLWGLGFGAFLAATVLPGGSELMLLAFVNEFPQTAVPAVVVATLGNTAGGMTSWWMGRAIPAHLSAQLAAKFAVQQSHVDKVKRWGSCSLLLSWLPLLGDMLCLIAGWLRLHWLPCLLFMAIGKFGRYALLAGMV